LLGTLALKGMEQSSGQPRAIVLSFDEVVLSALGECPKRELTVDPAREDKQGRLRVRGTHRVDHREPVRVGQCQVGQYQVVRRIFETTQRILQVRRDLDLGKREIILE
jgi:hypothetical protein